MDAQWVQDYFKTVDTLDADAIAAHFTDDGKFCFSNQPPAIGKQAIRDALDEQRLRLESDRPTCECKNRRR